MFRLKDVVLRNAVDHAAGMVCVVEIDQMVRDEVHRAMEFAEGLVIETAHPLAAASEATIVDVWCEQLRQCVEVLTIHRQGVAYGQVLDCVARH
jgi:hypothetical protein